MTFVLSKPGDVTDWVNLGDALLTYAGHEDTAPELAERIRPIEVRVHIMSRGQYLQLLEMQTEGATLVERQQADAAAVRAGLAELRGADLSMADGDKLFDALASSNLEWLVASVVLQMQRVDADQRSGFFTRAAADSTTAPAAAPG